MYSNSVPTTIGFGGSNRTAICIRFRLRSPWGCPDVYLEIVAACSSDGYITISLPAGRTITCWNTRDVGIYISGNFAGISGIPVVAVGAPLNPSAYGRTGSRHISSTGGRVYMDPSAAATNTDTTAAAYTACAGTATST